MSQRKSHILQQTAHVRCTLQTQWVQEINVSKIYSFVSLNQYIKIYYMIFVKIKEKVFFYIYKILTVYIALLNYKNKSF